MNAVEAFIDSNWSKCIKENREDEGRLIGLPYPYVVPAVGHFDELYYWDTFFINKGLIASGRNMQVKHNTDNMLYLVNRYGYMLNGSSKHFIGRSQPPFLSEMVRDTYDFYKDDCWLKNAYEILKIEYDFWMNERITPIGLNKYASSSAEGEIAAAKAFIERVGLEPEEDVFLLGKHTFASYESGWDITPRLDFEGYNYASVDLNSLMYRFEENMAYFSDEIKSGEEAGWKQRALKRKELMETYMLDENGLFLDYNFEKKKLSSIFSAASYFPLFAGIANASQAEALRENLCRIEFEFGTSACEKNNAPGNYQWDYPNGWACLQYMIIKGLDNYGFKEDALRIAKKYANIVERNFETTGNLWEKYNVVEGNINVTNEYEMPPMMGWSAGVYLASLNYINGKGLC